MVFLAALVAGISGSSATQAATQMTQAYSSTTPNLSGTWTLNERWENVPKTSPYYLQQATYTFVRTGPDTYSISNGAGWTTTNVTISGSSFTLWTCANGGTYSQKDEAACPQDGGYWLEPWHLNLDSSSGRYTATGTFQAHDVRGVGNVHGTFTALGPARPGTSLSVAVSLSKPQVALSGYVTTTVKVTAVGGAVKDVDLGQGLTLSSADAVVSHSPSGLSGFSLAADATRTFVFSVKGVKSGSETLSAKASGEASTGAVQGSDSAKLEVGLFTEISGKVVNAAGAFEVGIHIRITKSAGGGEPFSAETTTGSNGVYDFAKVPLGTGAESRATYEVKVLEPDADLFAEGPPATASLRLPGGVVNIITNKNILKVDDADFTEMVGEISGKVVTAAGAPVVGVQLRVTKTSGGGEPFTAKATTSAAGFYGFPELPLGVGADATASYRIEVVAPTPELFADGSPDKAQLGLHNTPATVLVGLSRGAGAKSDNIDYTEMVGEISGTIVTEGGTAVPGVKLQITKIAGGGKPFTAKATTSAAGSYDFTGVPLGVDANAAATYEIGIVSPASSLFAFGTPREVKPGAPSTADIIISRGASSIGKNTDFTKLTP